MLLDGLLVSLQKNCAESLTRDFFQSNFVSSQRSVHSVLSIGQKDKMRNLGFVAVIERLAA